MEVPFALHLAAVEEDTPAGRPVQSRNAAQKRCLAAAVRAIEADSVMRLQTQVHVPEHAARPPAVRPVAEKNMFERDDVPALCPAFSVHESLRIQIRAPVPSGSPCRRKASVPRRPEARRRIRRDRIRGKARPLSRGPRRQPGRHRANRSGIWQPSGNDR